MTESSESTSEGLLKQETQPEPERSSSQASQQASQQASKTLQHEWRHLPKAAILTMYISAVQKFVRENLFIFFGAGTGFAVSDWFGLRELFLIGGFLLLGGLLIAIIYHRRFQYKIDENNVRVRKGFFERKELKVPFDRVQTTGMSQPVYMKPLGLTRFSLQTPGAAITEVTLPGMPVVEAEALRDLIARIQYHGTSGQSSGQLSGQLSGQSSDPSVSNSDVPSAYEMDDAVSLYDAKAWDLFLYGLTSNQIWIMIGFLIGPLFGVFDDRIEDYFEWMQGLALFQALSLYDSPLLIILGLLTLIIAVGGLLMVISGLLAIVRFYGYSLKSQSDGFKSRFGLLDQREKTLKKVKLHSLEMVQTALGRAIGRWHLIGHQTGMSMLGGPDMKFLVPGVADEAVEPLAFEVDELNASETQVWQPIDPLLRKTLSVRISVVMIAAALLFQNVPVNDPVPMDVLSLIALTANLFVLYLVHLRCKRWGYAQENDTLMIRSGFIGQSIMRFQLQSCQQLNVTQSPLQRRRQIGTLHIRLPHGEVHIPWLELKRAKSLANNALYHVEAGAVQVL